MSEIKNAIERYKYAFAIWTDRADFINDKAAHPEEEGLLEIRCFDESGEFLAHRDTVDGTFTVREITADPARSGENVFSEETYAGGYSDEAQYLDIDRKKTEEKNDGGIYATGGGVYHLPEDAKDKALILVRTYYRFDEEGVARKYDWRLVCFTDAETVGRK